MLSDAIANDRIASAYLFEGPSASVKSSRLCVLRRKQSPTVTPISNIASRTQITRTFGCFAPGRRQPQYPSGVFEEEILPVAQYAPFEAPRSFLVFPKQTFRFHKSIPRRQTPSWNLWRSRAQASASYSSQRGRTDPTNDPLALSAPSLLATHERDRWNLGERGASDSRAITAHPPKGARIERSLAEDGLPKNSSKPQSASTRPSTRVSLVMSNLAMSSRNPTDMNCLETLHAYYRISPPLGSIRRSQVGPATRRSTSVNAPRGSQLSGQQVEPPCCGRAFGFLKPMPTHACNG